MTISHVYDTYAKTMQGKILHFDIVIDQLDQQKALTYAKEWLKNLGLEGACVFRFKVATYSRRMLPPIPFQSCH